MKVSKSWLQTYFSEPLPETEELVRLITFGIFEVEEVVRAGDDEVLDIKVLPDRASYCLSHRGIAREIGTLCNRPLVKDPLLEPLKDMPLSRALTVEIENSADCSMYSGALVRGVVVRPSPAWLKTYLETVGQRSINNIVDATNYVMLNLGQPLHAFDAGKMGEENGEYRIRVRAAKEGEKITVLTGETYDMRPDHVLITDAVHDAPIGIAGIKGGKAAEITEATRDIIIESAHFNYVRVRKTARALKLVTDASIRFQNEPAPALVPFALRDVVELILEIAGGTLEGVSVCGGEPEQKKPVSVSLSEIRGLLGAPISAEEVEEIWKRLGFSYVREGEHFTITPPFERLDLNIQEDLVEEVGRVYGYENIQAVVPQKGNLAPEVHARFYYSEKIRAALVARGFSEVYTYTLCAQGEVELANPLAADKAFMRAYLEEGVRKSLALNARMAPLLGLPMIKIFELGTVFKKTGEELALCIGASNTAGKASKAEEEIKNTLAHLAEVLGVPLDAPIKNGVAEFDLGRVIDTLPVPPGYEPFLEHSKKTFAPFSSFPFMLRDIALWTTEQTDAGAVEAVLRAHAGELLLRLDLFDEFTKDGRTSYAFHLVFQSFEKTLTDGEVNAVMEQVTRALQEKGWEVR